MNRITVFSALLLLCACSEDYTGLGSVDLQVTSITFNDSHPATITGILPSGKPAGFIEKADGPLINSMTVLCSSPADTQGMAEVNCLVGFPVFYSVEAGGSGTSFRIDYQGLNWEPEYAIVRENDLNRVYATANLRNMTVETWQVDTLRFTDPQMNQVTMASGRITVRQGTSRLPWWEAPAGNEIQVLRYGWPRQGRWNPLTAVYCPAGGRIESWSEEVWESGDTIYFSADSLVELNLSWEQHPSSYRCFLSLESISDQSVTWQIQWPDRLPRGARVEPGPASLQLDPAESSTILYREVY